MIEKWYKYGNGFMEVDREHIVGRSADVELMKTKLCKYHKGVREPGNYVMDGLEIIIDGFPEVLVGKSTYNKLYLYRVLEQIFEKEILTKNNKIKKSEVGNIYKVEVLKAINGRYPLIFINQPFNYCIAPCFASCRVL